MITCLVAVANFQVCLCRDHEVTFTNYKTKVAGCFCKASIRSHRTTCLTTPNPQPSTRLSALQLAKAKYQTLERISSVQELTRASSGSLHLNPKHLNSNRTRRAKV